VYVDNFNVTAIATAYTGQTGDELTGYEGTAVVTLPYRITRQQAVDLLVNDGIIINDAIAVVDTIVVNDGGVSDTVSVIDTIGVSDTIDVRDSQHDHASEVAERIMVWNFEVASIAGGSPLFPWAVVDSDFDTYADFTDEDDAIYVSNGVYHEIPGTPTYYRLCGRTGNVASGKSWYFRMIDGEIGESVTFYSGDSGNVKRSSWYAVNEDLDSNDDWIAAYGYVKNVADGTPIRPGEVWVEIKYTPYGTSTESSDVSKTGAATKSGSATKGGTVTHIVSKGGAASKDGTVTKNGTVTITGNSVADVEIGSLLTCNVDGYQDDGSGTITGTPDALIERPDHVFQHILTELLGESAGDIGTSFTNSGASYSTTYKFGFILHEVADQADKLLQLLAFECRSKFIEWRGKFELIYMGAAPAVTKTFTDDDLLAEPVFGNTDEIDIRNKIYARYSRDYRLSDGDGAYGGIVDDSDATSISYNGERIEMINLTACRDATMAADWVAWYLDQVKDIHKIVELLVPWVGKALGAGNTFGLTFDLFTGLTWDVVNAHADQDRERLQIKGMEWPT